MRPNFKRLGGALALTMVATISACGPKTTTPSSDGQFSIAPLFRHGDEHHWRP